MPQICPAMPLINYHWFIRDAWQQSLERGGQTSDDCILCTPGFQRDEHRIEAEAGVGADP